MSDRAVELWSPQRPLVNICNVVLATDDMFDNVKSRKGRGIAAGNQYFKSFTIPSSNHPTKKQVVSRFENAVQKRKAGSIFYVGNNS